MHTAEHGVSLDKEETALLTRLMDTKRPLTLQEFVQAYKGRFNFEPYPITLALLRTDVDGYVTGSRTANNPEELRPQIEKYRSMGF